MSNSIVKFTVNDGKVDVFAKDKSRKGLVKQILEHEICRMNPKSACVGQINLETGNITYSELHEYHVPILNNQKLYTYDKDGKFTKFYYCDNYNNSYIIDNEKCEIVGVISDGDTFLFGKKLDIGSFCLRKPGVIFIKVDESKKWVFNELASNKYKLFVTYIANTTDITINDNQNCNNYIYGYAIKVDLIVDKKTRIKKSVLENIRTTCSDYEINDLHDIKSLLKNCTYVTWKKLNSLNVKLPAAFKVNEKEFEKYSPEAFMNKYNKLTIKVHRTN